MRIHACITETSNVAVWESVWNPEQFCAARTCLFLFAIGVSGADWPLAKQ